MATIAEVDILEKRNAIMRASSRVSVIVAIPTATSDATAGVLLIKDPDPGDDPVTTADAAGNAKGGHSGGFSWKAFSVANAGTAYGV
jgi:hypothetical protein